MEIGKPGSQPRYRSPWKERTTPKTTLTKSGIDTRVSEGSVAVAPSADRAPTLATKGGTSEIPMPAPTNRKKSPRASLFWNRVVSVSRSPLVVFMKDTFCLAHIEGTTGG